MGLLIHILGNWTSDTSMVDILYSIWGLLLTPDMDDPAYAKRTIASLTFISNTIVAQKYYSDKENFGETIKDHITKHAAKSRKELGDEVRGKK